MIYFIFAAALQAYISTFCSIVVAVLFVHLLQYVPKKLQLFYGMISLFFMVMPTKVCALSVQSIFGQGLYSIVIAHMIMNVPFAVYVLYLVYKTVDMQLLVGCLSSGC